MKKTHLVAVLIIALLLSGFALSGCSSKTETPENTPKKALDGYPSKNIEVLVGYAAGGGSDIDARKMAEIIQAKGLVNKSFIVKNMAGAGGAMPVKELAISRKSDDHTFLVDTAHINSLWNGSVGNDVTLANLKPVCSVGEDYLLIMVKSDSKYKSLSDLLDALKKDTNSVNISLSTPLLSGECWVWDRIKSAAGISGQLTLVTHNGVSESLLTLLAGDSDVILAPPSVVKEHIAKGTLKALAVVSDKRLPDFPDTPTTVEKGLDVVFIKARGVLMGGGVSDEAVKYWEDIFRKLVETDEWKDYAKKTGQYIVFKGSQEYTNYIQKQGSSYQEYYQRESKKK